MYLQCNDGAIMASNEAKPPSALKSFISGGVGGVGLVIVGHPLDTIKVSLWPPWNPVALQVLVLVLGQWCVSSC